jgi:hypothetical protein
MVLYNTPFSLNASSLINNTVMLPGTSSLFSGSCALGGGVLLNQSRLSVLATSSFRRNAAFSSVSQKGGAVYAASSSTVRVISAGSIETYTGSLARTGYNDVAGDPTAAFQLATRVSGENFCPHEESLGLSGSLTPTLACVLLPSRQAPTLVGRSVDSWSKSDQGRDCSLTRHDVFAGPDLAAHATHQRPLRCADIGGCWPGLPFILLATPACRRPLAPLHIDDLLSVASQHWFPLVSEI